jgi:hypothetical protein
MSSGAVAACRSMLPDMDDVQLSERLGAIERQLRIISSHLGIDCPPFASDLTGTRAEVPAGGWSLGATQSLQSGLPADIVDLARTGHKIEAIKRLRMLTGASLREAKDAIDALGF